MKSFALFDITFKSSSTSTYDGVQGKVVSELLAAFVLLISEGIKLSEAMGRNGRHRLFVATFCL